jgi:hypothetical protein
MYFYRKVCYTMGLRMYVFITTYGQLKIEALTHRIPFFWQLPSKGNFNFSIYCMCACVCVCVWGVGGVLTTVVMKSSVFRNITLCSPLKGDRLLRRTCRLHLQGPKINQVSNQRESRWLCLSLLTNYTELYSRKYNSSLLYILSHI